MVASHLTTYQNLVQPSAFCNQRSMKKVDKNLHPLHHEYIVDKQGNLEELHHQSSITTPSKILTHSSHIQS